MSQQALLNHLKKNGGCWFTRDELRLILNVSDRSLSNTIKSLLKCGRVKKVKVYSRHSGHEEIYYEFMDGPEEFFQRRLHSEELLRWPR